MNLDETTTTVRARFTSCAGVRSFFADRYHGMAPDETNIARTCENYGIKYTPPFEVIVYPAPEFERFWECEA